MPTGMELAVRLPLAPASPRRLLDVIDKIPGTETPTGEAGGNELRWLNGVTFEPWPCRGLSVIAAVECTDETLAAITATCEPAVTQSPFQIIDALKVSTLEWSVDEVDEMLSARAQIMLSAAFASELISGTASGGISLSSEAHAPDDIAFGTAAKPVWEVLAALENELAQNMPGQRGLIHVPPGLLSTVVGSYGAMLNMDGFWETANGNIIVSDAGYFQPAPPSGQAAAAVGSDWIYASGPVWWQATDVMGLGVSSEAYDMSRNTIHRWVSGYGIVVFDSCPVTAALATYGTL